MFTEIRQAARRSSAYLVRDAAGAAALVAMLLVGLNWPGLF